MDPLLPRPAWSDPTELQEHLDRAAQSLEREEQRRSRWLALGFSLAMAVQAGCSLAPPVAVYGGPPVPSMTPRASTPSPTPVPHQPVPPYGRPPQPPPSPEPPSPPPPTPPPPPSP